MTPTATDTFSDVPSPRIGIPIWVEAAASAASLKPMSSAPTMIATLAV